MATVLFLYFMPLSKAPFLPVVWKTTIPVWSWTSWMFHFLTPQPAMMSIRPAAAAYTSFNRSLPATTSLCCPDVRIVLQPSSMAFSSVSMGSLVISKARWSVTSIPPAQSIIRFIFSISRSPSGVKAPITTPLAPRRRNMRISSHINSISFSV